MKRLLIAISSVILALVIMMIIVGSMTFEGTVVKDPYTTALHWDTSHHEQLSTGWKVKLRTAVVRSPSAELIVSIADRNGNSLDHADVQLFLTRPSTDRYDSTYAMEQKTNGSFGALVQVPVKGRWSANLTVKFDGKSVVFTETLDVE